MDCIKFNKLLREYNEENIIIYCDINNIDFKLNVESKLSVIHINIRIINKNFETLIIYLQSLVTKFDVII